MRSRRHKFSYFSISENGNYCKKIFAGKVGIPAGIITSKKDGSFFDIQINFRSFSRNTIEDTRTIYDKTKVNDVKAIYPMHIQMIIIF